MEKQSFQQYGYPVLLSKEELDNYNLQFQTTHRDQKLVLSFFEGPSLDLSYADILVYFDETYSLVLMAPYFRYKKPRNEKIKEVETLQNTLRRVSMEVAGLVVNNYEQCKGLILPGYSEQFHTPNRKYRAKYLFVVTDFKRMQEDGSKDIFAEFYGEKIWMHTDLLPFIFEDKEFTHGQSDAYQLFCEKYLKNVHHGDVEKW